jgi:hypothetical protein
VTTDVQPARPRTRRSGPQDVGEGLAQIGDQPGVEIVILVAASES